MDQAKRDFIFKFIFVTISVFNFDLSYLPVVIKKYFASEIMVPIRKCNGLLLSRPPTGPSWVKPTGPRFVRNDSVTSIITRANLI